MAQTALTASDRRTQQKRAALGIGAGVVAGVIGYILLREILPPASSPNAARLWLLLTPAVLLFVMVAAVGQGRFLTEAIDPLAHREGRFIAVTNRVLRNTVEQTLILLLAALALSLLVPEGTRFAFPAVAVLFAVARILFWIGYLVDPIYRAPGMAMTMTINIGLLAWAVTVTLR